MTLRWTDDQLEAHRRRMGGAKGSQVSVGKVVIKVDEAGAKIVRLPKPSKFSNVKTGRHASKKEAKRYQELYLMLGHGVILNLREQVRYELIPAQYVDGKCVERAIVYIADFTYDDATGFVVEDCKGYRTPIYRIKKKLMLFRHGIRIKET